MDFPHFFFASRDNHPSYIRQDCIKQSHDTVCMYLFFLYINHIHVQEERDVYQFYLIRSWTEDLCRRQTRTRGINTQQWIRRITQSHTKEDENMPSSKVVIGVMVGMVIAGLPLLNKTVYQREQNVHRMRDDQYDLKDSARSSRLSRKNQSWCISIHGWFFFLSRIGILLQILLTYWPLGWWLVCSHQSNTGARIIPYYCNIKYMVIIYIY